MNYETYASVIEKAKAALAQKEIPGAGVKFADIRVGVLKEKAFWFISGVKRKLMRRIGK